MSTQQTAIHKLTALRQQMQQNKIDYYLVPSSDPHQNETPPACWQRRAWISGFTGSAGLALIGHDTALLWTDGRYFEQAASELATEHWQLMKQGTDDPNWQEWLNQQGQGLRIAVDPNCISIEAATHVQTALHTGQHELRAVEPNFIDLIWQQQPTLPKQAIALHDTTYNGRSCADKLSAVRQWLSTQQQNSLIITTLDDIAWLLNLRGTDIEYTPVFISALLVCDESCHLFISPEQFTPEIQDYCQQQDITYHPYASLNAILQAWHKPICVDPKQCSWAILNHGQTLTIAHQPSPIPHMKAIKNTTEQQGMRDAHIADALALCRFFAWLETEWPTGVTEISAANQLQSLRCAHPLCRDLSFPSISGFAENSAIIHYQPQPSTDKVIDDSNIYLIDSGGQYLNGTTDVTRCLHFGEPTPAQKQHYTLVLKGHLALRQAVFLAGTTGNALDCIARQALWQAGYDYAHGTGHGVGHYLCVHEGPQSISPRANTQALKAGMVVSNEPGLYLSGQYGIRIENLLLVEAKQQPNEKHSVFREMLGFSDLTLVPYAHNLIDIALLTEQEVDAINDYHETVYQQLSQHCQSDGALKTWLEFNTRKITQK